VTFVTHRECNEAYGAHTSTGDTIMDLRNIDLRTKAQAVANTAAPELSDEQLSSVSGGKGKAAPSLMKACATGVHIRDAKIT
jgi:hypothetical protein